MDKKAKIATIAILILIGILPVGLVIAAKGGSGGKGRKECNDGLDNDGDGFIDLADTGCNNKGDKDETNCGDGVCEGGETSSSCSADCGVPDSCSDTDGGIVFEIKGTTNGYYNNNTPYSFTDYCLDSENLKEYYCLGTISYTLNSNCNVGGNFTNATTMCLNGACV